MWKVLTLVVGLVAIAVAVVLLWTPADTPSASPGPIDFGSVPPFRLVDTAGRPIANADLAGSVWVAGFIFTRCHQVCPMVTGVMAQLRAELPNEVKLVTITVDPEFDTPDVLRQYAERSGADVKHWWFLTGEKDQVTNLVRDGFKLGIQENSEAPAGERVTHSSRLALVACGRILGYFDSTDPAAVAELKRRAVNETR